MQYILKTEGYCVISCINDYLYITTSLKLTFRFRLRVYLSAVIRDFELNSDLLNVN